MAKKVLSIVDTAYRGTLEEQDDTSVWFTTLCNRGDLDVTVLLTGNAVNYAVKGQEAESLSFGTAKIPHPVRMDQELERLTKDGASIYAVREDVEERGIQSGSYMAGVELMPRSGIPKLLEQHDLVWHW